MTSSQAQSDIINEIISEMTLPDKTALASMTDEDIEILEVMFDQYIGIRTGLASGDREYTKNYECFMKKASAYP